MNILLIGHRGYLGRGLLSYLNPRHRVVGWDKEENIFALTADLLAHKKIDVVINLSVMADRHSENFQLDSPTHQVNVEGAQHLARILKGSKIAWIQISTREVYGNSIYGPKDIIRTKKGYRPKFLVNETFSFAPQNCYAKSKLIAEMISESHPYSNVIRLTTGYTDLDNPAGGNWVVQLIRTALQGNPVHLTKGGLQFRDPMHMDDLGRLIEKLLDKKIYSKKLNIGGGQSNLISLREFVRLAVPNVRILRAPDGDYGFAFQNRLAFQLTGWKPQVLFREKIPIITQNILQGLQNLTPK